MAHELSDRTLTSVPWRIMPAVYTCVLPKHPQLQQHVPVRHHVGLLMHSLLHVLTGLVHTSQPLSALGCCAFPSIMSPPDSPHPLLSLLCCVHPLCHPFLAGYSPRECPSGKGLSSKGRCVPIRDPTIESVEAKVYQATFTDDSCDESEEDLIPIVGTGPAARKASASKAAAAAAKTAGAKYSRKTYAPATLPDGAVVAKVVFKVDTSSAPKGATGVRCVVTSDDDVKNKLADLPDGEWLHGQPCMFCCLYISESQPGNKGAIHTCMHQPGRVSLAAPWEGWPMQSVLP